MRQQSASALANPDANLTLPVAWGAPVEPPVVLARVAEPVAPAPFLTPGSGIVLQGEDRTESCDETLP